MLPGQIADDKIPLFMKKRHIDVFHDSRIAKPELLLNALRICVANIGAAPDLSHVEILKGVTQNLFGSLRDESLSPERLSDPVAKFAFISTA